MFKRPDPEQQRESTLLLTLLALFLFASPFNVLWAADDSPWFLPYLLWLLVILIGAWLSHRYRRHDL
ncbi:MAG: UTP--glucose-1-phosphate uridylyltransferase [Sedimenticola sp.]